MKILSPPRLRMLVLLCALTATTTAFAADEIHWTITGQTSVTFDWRGPENVIRYGLTSAYGQTVTAQTPSPLPFSSSGPFWEAKITSLQENTLYHYLIGTGPDHTFRTPPSRGSSGFSVYVEGDIGDSTSYTNMPIIQSQIAVDLPVFSLMIGDLTYGNAHGQSHVDQHFNDVMVWSRDAAYMPAWGNHEWDQSTDDLRNYKGRFDFINPQTSPGCSGNNCGGEDWYWFDYGNVRFIAYPEPYGTAVDDWKCKISNKISGCTGSASGVMDIAQSDPAITFIVTFGHRPAYSSGHHVTSTTDTRKVIMDALGDTHSKYVLNLNGHSHNYERTHPQHGVTHITAGTGGANLEQSGSTIPGCLWAGGCPAPAYTAFRAMRQGPVKLTFTSTAIQGKFICGPTGGGTNDLTGTQCPQGSVGDSFTIGTPGGGTTPPAPPNNLQVK